MSASNTPKSALAPRAKIGILVPVRNTTVEPESHAMCPPGVSNHVARMAFKDTPPDFDPTTVKIGAYDLDPHGAIDRLKAMCPDIILLGHSHDSFIGGVAGGQRMQDGLTEYAGLPVIVPSMAYLAAIKALGIRNVGILTPYLSADDGLVKGFFEDSGCRVRRIKPLQYETAYAIAATDAAIVRASFDELDGDDIDAILQVGTNLAAATVAAEAEARLGKPVLSVNVVSYWHALRQIGIDDKASGPGVLFAEH
jgi:maleate isomerase